MRRFITVTIMAIALLVAVPSLASAAYYGGPGPSATGWGYQVSGTAVWCELACTRTAYRWTGSNWVTTSRHNGTEVYVYPYASGWHWTWTSDTGWLAMRDSDLTRVIHYL